MSEECKTCIWQYNGICCCSGIKPCELSEDVDADVEDFDDL